MPEADDAIATWDEVAARLAPPRNYWLVTSSPRGGPHAAPVWGVVNDGAFYCVSTRSTRKSRNLLLDARAVVHLESGDDVVIVRGRMADEGVPGHSPVVVRALHDKYTEPGDEAGLPPLDPSGAVDEGLVLYRLEPEGALVWSLADSDGSPRRWSAT